MNTFLIILAILIILVIIWIALSLYAIYGIESPAYRVMEQKGEYEIREYENYIVAEVEVEGSMKKALYAGFRQLAGYIFGGNTSRTFIGVSSTLMQTMRAPEKIAMTTPVMNTTMGGGKHIIAFTMPSMYTLETLPKPHNANIRFKKVENSRRAVLRYTGYVTTRRAEAKKKILRGLLIRDGYIMKGEIISAQYNPPLSFPLLRRNEVMVELEV